MASNLSDYATPATPLPGHAGAASIAMLDSPAMDSESAALFRAWLCPLIDSADSWGSLAEALADKGYRLGFRRGRLVLIRDDNGRALCTARFLGTNLREMVDRLGRPMVRARPDRAAAGEVIGAATLACVQH